jgi:hypothetical protein
VVIMKLEHTIVQSPVMLKNMLWRRKLRQTFYIIRLIFRLLTLLRPSKRILTKQWGLDEINGQPLNTKDLIMIG